MLGATRLPPIPYPAVRRHGVIGDRRTAALVAADGTIDWLCLPDYDGDVICGALLDTEQGGFWRLGPAATVQGSQEYLGDSAALVTSWSLGDARLELTDLMAWPATSRPPGREAQRFVIRRLRCAHGQAACTCAFVPRHDFRPVQPAAAEADMIAVRAGSQEIGLWLSRPLEGVADGHATFTLHQGEEIWSVLTVGVPPAEWSARWAADVLADTTRYWHQWHDGLSYGGPRGDRVRRSALLVHLLTYAPAGSQVAAPTTSLPERIGGNWTADYRLAWVRDASMSMSTLAQLGNTDDAGRFLEWLHGLPPGPEGPLQVLYSVRGQAELPPRERDDLYGYRGSKPVRFRNHAYQQRQLDAFGYLNDCCHTFLTHGGDWRPEFWDLVRRAADHVAESWHQPDNSIWELPERQHYVSGKVMSWVALDRACKIAAQLGHTADAERWRPVMDAIHAEVMDKGWSEALGAFKQRYEGDNLDSSVLLIPVMGFLPADHPRVTATVERIEQSLNIDGLLYRFDPRQTPGMPPLPLGEFEGSFWPCTFWLATTYAKLGRPDRAESILDRAEAMVGPLGLFAEGVDSRTGMLLGNYPLLFSQTEYVRAVLETSRARPFSAARQAVGKVTHRLGRLVKG